jgi:hypothetical protein
MHAEAPHGTEQLWAQPHCLRNDQKNGRQQGGHVGKAGNHYSCWLERMKRGEQQHQRRLQLWKNRWEGGQQGREKATGEKRASLSLLQR